MLCGVITRKYRVEETPQAKAPLKLPPVQVHWAGPEECVDAKVGVCETHDSKVGCVEHMIQRWGAWNP